jgi:hypothetical protein
MNLIIYNNILMLIIYTIDLLITNIAINEKLFNYKKYWLVKSVVEFQKFLNL